MDNNNMYGCTKFCKFCGKEVAFNAVVCPHCGRQIEELKSTSVINLSKLNIEEGQLKQKSVSLILCCISFLGVSGLHKFYENKYALGVIYLLTGGIFLIGTIIDLLTLLGQPKYYTP